MNQIVPVLVQFRSLALVCDFHSFLRVMTLNDFLDPHQLLARYVSDRRGQGLQKNILYCKMHDLYCY